MSMDNEFTLPRYLHTASEAQLVSAFKLSRKHPVLAAYFKALEREGISSADGLKAIYITVDATHGNVICRYLDENKKNHLLKWGDIQASMKSVYDGDVVSGEEIGIIPTIAMFMNDQHLAIKDLSVKYLYQMNWINRRHCMRELTRAMKAGRLFEIAVLWTLTAHGLDANNGKDLLRSDWTKTFRRLIRIKDRVDLHDTLECSRITNVVTIESEGKVLPIQLDFDDVTRDVVYSPAKGWPNGYNWSDAKAQFESYLEEYKPFLTLSPTSIFRVKNGVEYLERYDNWHRHVSELSLKTALLLKPLTYINKPRGKKHELDTVAFETEYGTLTIDTAKLADYPLVYTSKDTREMNPVHFLFVYKVWQSRNIVKGGLVIKKEDGLTSAHVKSSLIYELRYLMDKLNRAIKGEYSRPNPKNIAFIHALCRHATMKGVYK